MRSLAPIAIIGSLFLVANVNGQSLTENAAAIAGATIGTAAGKPLGTALGNIFGKLDQDTSKAANAKTAKPDKTEKTAEKKEEKPAAPDAPKQSSAGPGPLGESSVSPASGGHRSRAAEPAPTSFTVPFVSPAPAAPIEPPVRQLSAADVANIRVGASGQDVQSALGVPESRVVIPGDDGRLLEICQYWSNGQPVGTVHIVNGQVESVTPSSTN